MCCSSCQKTGYPTTNDARVGVERGELQGMCLGWESVKSASAQWLDDKYVRIFVQNGTTWSQQAELTASNGTPLNLFGSCVALRGDTAVAEATVPQLSIIVRKPKPTQNIRY